MRDTHYEDILGKQLAMNRQTWAAMQKHGVMQDSQLRLDFSYNAPSHEAADKLCALLRAQRTTRSRSSRVVHFYVANGKLREKRRIRRFRLKF